MLILFLSVIPNSIKAQAKMQQSRYNSSKVQVMAFPALLALNTLHDPFFSTWFFKTWMMVVGGVEPRKVKQCNQPVELELFCMIGNSTLGSVVHNKFCSFSIFNIIYGIISLLFPLSLEFHAQIPFLIP